VSEKSTVSIAVGDRVVLRKPHPCGSLEWIITRVGTDVGLRCAGCERTVLLTRSVFNKQLKTVIASHS
jgi:hypothetical protein